ncbi:MAG: DUF4160 domain-containing protein [Anaerolineae bacterium]
MPEISRFFGIIIRMYVEVGAPHHFPHLHAYCQNAVGIYRIDQIEMIEGTLSKREQRLIEAWIVLHQNELLENWERLQAGELPFKIAPLK